MNGKLKDILEWVYCIVIALVIAFLIKGLIGTPTVVEQRSMTPTFEPGQRLILNKWSRTIKSEIKRGDVITFEAPINETEIGVDTKNPIAKYNPKPKNIFKKFAYYSLEIGKTSYIKRVIGLPGEHVKIENGKVYINEQELKEEYLNNDVYTDSLEGAFIDLYVPENCIFALGDNRPQSTDSRRFGCIPLEKIESKVAFRFWPLNVFGGVK